MKKNTNKLFGYILPIIAVLFFGSGSSGFAQETTGNIEITVRDSQGAVVPNASVTITSSSTARSSTTGFRRTVTTDEEGFQRIFKFRPELIRLR